MENDITMINMIITQKDDTYHAIADGAMFSGSGKSLDEAIGKCLIANREQFGFTFEYTDKDGVKHLSTVYGKSRNQ